MDIFVRNIPKNATRKEMERFFGVPLKECGINTYYCDKHSDKPHGVITVLEVKGALRFLELYSVPAGSGWHVRSKKQLYWHGTFIQCWKNRSDPTEFSLLSVAYEASQRAQKTSVSYTQQRNNQNAKITRFAIRGLHCGTWDYADGHLVFMSHFTDARQGTISFGYKEAVVMLGGAGSDQCRIDFSYHDCNNVVLGRYKEPSVSFAQRNAPKFYEVSGDDVLAAALLSMTLGPNAARQKTVKKTRLPGINKEHERVTGSNFVYRITLSDYSNISPVHSLIKHNPKIPSAVVMVTAVLSGGDTLRQDFARLKYELTTNERYGTKPYSMLYQLEALATNGVLPPRKVIDLLSKVAFIHGAYGLDATLSALRRFHRRVPPAGPETAAGDLSNSSLQKLLEDFAIAYDQYRYNPENPYELTKRHVHINLIHKIIITPAGLYLHGPEPEPTNRVLRRYTKHNDHFIRAVFQDENGGVRYDPRASQEKIFQERFKRVLDDSIVVAGRRFSFLGFSHSSLRSQSCWFMAPMYIENTFELTTHVLEGLGDFKNIRVPAKCAARIGQNFTDTNASVDLREGDFGYMAMVQRNGRDFSDGVGTISWQLLQRVWRVYGTRRQLKPTVLQIRFQGAKGMVSLDSTLLGQKLMLRDNMKKFETSSAWNLEICGAGFRPLPMVLNRQFTKILEDLGIEDSAFIDLQKTAVDKLRCMTTSAVNAATFLEEIHITRATRMPSLIRHLNQIGLDYHQDSFLYGVVEMGIITKLRDIKYRGRIPVDAGFTLYGIMDETKILQEGEIFVVTEQSPEGGRRVLIQDHVAITRSPALHPGDVQIVKAVDVSEDSPLKRLSNVVVFSQHGMRDLASKLSGGDLDGDIYNVIYDRRLIPTCATEPADYPRVAAKELDRTVSPKDMSDFFIQFMESDQLGMLCNVHMQLADQRLKGTFDEDCIKLASMASTAVDFSKTGIPVKMKDCPKYDRCRPDFMAPSPRVLVSEQGYIEFEEEDNEEDEAFEGLDAERRSFRYYESKRILGQLYRAIDERTFLAKMQQNRRSIVASAPAASASLLQQLLAYMKRLASSYGVTYNHHQELASEIRYG